MHAGGANIATAIGLLSDKGMKKCVLGYFQLSENMFFIKMKANYFKISILSVYELTAQNIKIIRIFYYRLENVKSQCKLEKITIVIEEMNAKVDKERNGEIGGLFL